MSICNPCQKTELIPKCVENIIIGSITSFTTAVYIYIRDNTDDRITRFERISDGAGLVTLTGLNTEPDFMPDHSYELWITLKTATSIEDRETITVGVTDVDCVSMEFVEVQEA